MKYSLTIHDLNASQVTDLMNRVEGAEITTVRLDNVVQLPPIGSAAAVAAVVNQNQQAAAVTVEDANTIMTAPTSELLKSVGTVGEVDSENLPWDGRIHSGSRKKNADGKWKLLKNVDPALVASIKAELYGRNNTPVETPTVPAFLQNMPVAAPATVPATYVAPVAAPVPASPIMAQPQAPATRDFSGLMLQISKLFAAKQITPDYPTTIVNRVNAGFNTKIATLTDVANDPRMVEYSWQCLDVDGKAA